MPRTFVTLRDVQDAGGTRQLWATLEPSGAVKIEGVDRGPGVSEVLGVSEYEWAWTIPAQEIPALVAAMGAGDDVLEALGICFRDERAAGLKQFLETEGIVHESWSRMGD